MNVSHATQFTASICEKYGISEIALRGEGRSKNIVRARCEFSRQMRGLGYSYPEIGRMLNKDHSTIVRQVQKQR